MVRPGQREIAERGASNAARRPLATRALCPAVVTRLLLDFPAPACVRMRRARSVLAFIAIDSSLTTAPVHIPHSTDGLKADLLERLEVAIAEEAEDDAAVAAEGEAAATEAAEKEPDVPQGAAPAVAETPKEEAPAAEEAKAPAPAAEAAPVPAGEAGEPAKPSSDAASAAKARFDEQEEKKRRRAERFGIPYVPPKPAIAKGLKAAVLDEKKAARAARFGLEPKDAGVSKGGKKNKGGKEKIDNDAEAARRAARAERFGDAGAVDPEFEAKKKARAERFGSKD